MKDIKIRPISINDYEMVTLLTNQLGSKTTNEIVNKQIEEIIINPDHDAFVAEKDNIIIGYIHCFKAIRLTTKPFIEICGLVVDEKERGNGIGKSLVKYIEELYSKEYVIRVRCNSKRELAHKFYQILDYKLKKEQKVFEKIS